MSSNIAPNFLKLPLELRINIYECLFDGCYFVVERHSTTKKHEPDILQTCKQIYNEAKPVLVDAVIVQIVGDIFIDEVDIIWNGPIDSRIPQTILQTARKIHITQFSERGTKILMEILFTSFPNLQQIHFTDECHISPLGRCLDISTLVYSIPNDATARFMQGDFDERLVMQQNYELDQGEHKWSSIMKSRQEVGKKIRIIVTSMVILMLLSGDYKIKKPPVARALTYDYDTLEILETRNTKFGAWAESERNKVINACRYVAECVRICQLEWNSVDAGYVNQF